MTHLLATEDIRRLSNGSFEDIIARLSGAVSEAAVKVFGEAVDTKVVSTFPGYAIVLAENGKAARVQFDEANDGTLLITSHEDVPLKVFDKKDMASFVVEEAKSVVKAIIEGKADAGLMLAALIETVEIPSKVAPDAAIVAALETISPPVEWRTIWEHDSALIKRSCWNEGLKQIEDNRILPKYADLTEEDAGRRMVVITDLKHLAQALRDDSDTLEGTGLEDPNVDWNKVGPPFDGINHFHPGLKTGVGALDSAIQTILAHVDDASLTTLGQAHDAIAERLFPYQVSICFCESALRKVDESRAS